MKRIFFVIFPILSFFNPIFAQEAFIKQYSIKDGLPTNMIFNAYISSDGLMWFASNEGIIRFDGKNIYNFSRKEGLSDNKPRKIKEDFSGRLWFLNEDGTLNYYFQGVIYNEINDPLLADLKSNFPYTDFYQDEDSTLYFYNINSEVAVVKKQTLIDFSNFKINYNPYEAGLFYLNKLADGRLLLWTSKGIYHLDGVDDSLRLKPHQKVLEKVFPVSKNESIGLERDGYLNYYVGSSMAQEHFLKFENPYITSLIVDDEGYIWVASTKKGIFCYKGGKVILHLDIFNIFSLLKDQENNIWATSSNEGVFKINRQILKYKYFGKSQFNGEGIRGLAKSNFGGVWATNGNQLFLVKETGVFFLPLKFEGDDLNFIYHFKNNTLIASGDGSELYELKDVRFDDESNSLLFDNRVTKSYRVKKIIVDKSEEYIYSFINDLFIKISMQDSSYVFYPFKLGRINNVFFDRNEDIIINASVNSRIKRYQAFFYSDLSPINGERIISHINIDDNSELYVVEPGDLYLLNKNQLFNLSKDFNNQIDLHIKNFVYDGSTLYFNTVKNIYFISDPLRVVQGEPVELNRLDIEFNNITDVLCYDNTLYVASDDGLILFPLSDLEVESALPPKPFIENVLINNEATEFSDGVVKFDGLNKITIDFYSINFSTLTTVYSYKLEGYDETWTEGSETRVKYSNLPPGNYSFKLLARKTGETATNAAELSIVVKPTLFQRTITWIAAGVIFVSLLIVVVVRQKNRQLKKKETERMLLTLEHKALQSMMNPHFIFNALGSIQSYLLQNKAIEAGTYLSQFARLIRQNMNSLKSNFISIEDEIDRLRNYLDLEKFRMNNKFDYAIEFEDEIDLDEVCIPSMVVQPFVENAIWHGISPLQTNTGKIRVSFEKANGKSIQILIEDNGVGTQKTGKSSNTGEHLNLGMNLTEKRLKLIGEKYQVKTEIVIEEFNPGGINPGTRIKVIVPISGDGIRE